MVFRSAVSRSKRHILFLEDARRDGILVRQLCLEGVHKIRGRPLP